ncbi:glycine-rich protein 2 [Folsomia candida]|uniref:glycine-rich protein 2 n=1 Tax=Folsomia candida TaxID=158441 RepID=UPI000B90494E|nr:glycine-rich protein 2 [Folsomia candida]
MNKTILSIFVVLVAIAVVHAGNEVTKTVEFTPPASIVEGLKRLKRGYGGGGGGGHGHGPGSGGGAAGPVYICGYIGSKEGYGGGYGR